MWIKSCYPVYTDSILSWSPSLADVPTGSALEYIVVKFPFLVYLSSVEIYETYNPGGTVGIMVTTHYNHSYTE